jgi:hypothetical protein
MADIHTTSKLPDLELQVLSELVREVHLQQKVTKVLIFGNLDYCVHLPVVASTTLLTIVITN